MERLKPSDAKRLYRIACYHALIAELASRAGSGQPVAASRTAADKAVGALHRAIAAGYRDLAKLRSDPDLEALRARADFKMLMHELEARPADAPSGKAASSAKKP